MEERGCSAAGLLTWHNVYTIDRGVLFEEALRRVREEAELDPDTFSGFYLSTNAHNGYEFPVLASAHPPALLPPPHTQCRCRRCHRMHGACSAALMQDWEHRNMNSGSLTWHQRPLLQSRHAEDSSRPTEAITLGPTG